MLKLGSFEMIVEEQENILIHPRKGKNEKDIPQTGLLLVNPTEASSCFKKLKAAGASEQFLFNSGLVVDKGTDFFAAGPAIGAPVAVMALEKLIALGARKIILFGWCGAISRQLQVGDILLPDSAVVGEGTSQYYNSTESSAPSKEFRKKIEEGFIRSEIPVKSGRVWSTDGIYREDKTQLKKLHEDKQVDAVDMEFSALCSVASFRKVEFAAVLIVSDELWGKSWRPGFSAKAFQSSKKMALNVLLENNRNL